MTRPPPIPAARPAPIPVQPLTYSQPWRSARPGLLTTIGVVSIVIGSLSIFANASSILQAVMFGVMSKVTSMASTMATPPPPPAPVVVAAPPGGATGTTPAPTTSAATAAATPTTVPAGLTRTEIQGVMQRVQASANKRLNLAQVDALDAALQDNSTPLVSSTYLFSPVLMASVDGDNQADVYFNGGGHIQIDASGNVLARNAGGGANMPTFWPFKVSLGACILTATTGLLGLGFAIFLLVAGIMVLRHSPTARRLHRIFAAVKIPLALATAAADAWFATQLTGFASPSPVTGQTLFYLHFVGWSVVGLAYPIGLLIALRSRSVREYYASVRSA